MILKERWNLVKKLVPQQPQTQVATSDQLDLLIFVANRLGLYDAADYLAYRSDSQASLSRFKG